MSSGQLVAQETKIPCFSVMTVNPSRSDVRLRPGRDSRSLGWKVPFSPGVTVAHLPGEKDTSER